MVERQIKLIKYLGIVWHWAWLLIILTALAGGIAFAVSRVQTPVYQSTATLLIDEAPGTRGSADYNAVLVSERRAQTYNQMLLGQRLLGETLKQHDGLKDLPPQQVIDDFKKLVEVQVVRNTQLIRITVKDTNPERAAMLANRHASVFATEVRNLQAQRYSASKDSLSTQIRSVEAQIAEAEKALAAAGTDAAARERVQNTLVQYRQGYNNLLQTFEQVRLAEAQSNSNITQIEMAVPAFEPFFPRVTQITALGSLLGLLVAIGLVFLIEALDNSVKDPDALAEQLGLPILGFISHFELPQGVTSAKRSRPIVVEEPRSHVAEAFRILRTNIEYASVDKPIRRLLVTSAFSGDGKSTVVSNLGSVIAQSEKGVVLVDADLRRPSLHRNMDSGNSVGLSNLFVHQDMHINEVVQRTFVYGVSLLSAGPTPPNPAELLATKRMDDILAKISDSAADMVIIDAPPVMPVTDAMVLAPRVDGVLLIVRAGVTRVSAVLQTVENLRRANANIIGIVVNDVARDRIRGYYYRRREYYYSKDNRQSSGGASLEPATP